MGPSQRRGLSRDVDADDRRLPLPLRFLRHHPVQRRLHAAEDARVGPRRAQALYNLGYRGGVFTVDDNFVGNPVAIESILHVMIDFQRQHDYPFSFYTQASLDLGSPKLSTVTAHETCGVLGGVLGIENPDPAALRGMNKKQNTKVDIAVTVRQMQTVGIEVMAGFIFGSDEDTIETAGAVASFAAQAAIPLR